MNGHNISYTVKGSHGRWRKCTFYWEGMVSTLTGKRCPCRVVWREDGPMPDLKRGWKAHHCHTREGRYRPITVWWLIGHTKLILLYKNRVLTFAVQKCWIAIFFSPVLFYDNCAVTICATMALLSNVWPAVSSVIINVLVFHSCFLLQ